MNKYELALVVSAKIEDDARTATVEKAKDYIVRAGGTVTAAVEQDVRIMDNVLRFLCVRKDEAQRESAGVMTAGHRREEIVYE